MVTLAEFINKVGFKVNDEDVKNVNNTISNIKSTATQLLGAIGIGFSLSAINELAEEFGAVNDSIRSSIGELDNLDEVQQRILNGANDARVAYSDMATTVSNLVKSSPGLFPVDEAVEFSSNVAKLLKTAGRSEQTITSVTEGLNKSFQKGIVESETLNVLLEQSPEAADLLAEHLGVAKSKLLDMATDGQIKVTDLKDAFLDASEEINAAFANVDMRVSDALTNIRNKWGLWIAQTDKTLEMSKTIAKIMISAFDRVMAVLTKVRTGVVWLTERLGGTENLLKLVAMVAGTIFFAFNFAKIKSGLETVLKFIKNIQLKTVAMIAVIVILALLVEDFINFMNGNNSLIGTFLEKAGMDIDEVRESFKALGEQFKDLIGVIKDFGAALFSSAISILAMLLELLMTLIVALLPVIIDLLNSLIPLITQILQAILPVIITLINQVISFVGEIIKAILPILIQLITTLIPILTKIIQAILPVIINLIKSILPLVVQIIESILPVIIDLINAIIPLLMDIISGVLPVIIDLINELLPIIIQIIEMVLPVIIQLLQELIPFFLQIIETILPVIIQLINTLLPIITQVIDAILPVLLELITAILPPFMQIIEAILPVIISLISQIMPILQPIVSLIANLVQAILPVVISVLNAIVPIIKTITSVLGPVFNIISAIVGAISKVIGWVANGLGWIVDLFFGDSSGASSKASAVAAYADGTDYSEDTFIAGEEGPELITNSRGKKVYTALETGNIFNALGMIAQARNVNSGTASVITNSSDIKKSIIQNVNINNKFNGDRAIQEQAAGAMDDSAKDITAELARGLVFVG